MLVPENLGIVLYCSSVGELTSARVAVALQKKGISNVWVLEGGLTAWEKESLPVTLHLSTSSEAAERLGIKIIENQGTQKNRWLAIAASIRRWAERR